MRNFKIDLNMSYREIKFRGKCKTTGEWFYGYLFKSDSVERKQIIKNHKGCLDTIDSDYPNQIIPP